MRLNIALKIFGIALVVLALMVAVTVYSIHLTANISDELDTVAGKNLPVSEAVTRVNVRMLEQGVLLQRLFVLVGDDAPEKAVARARERFETLGAEIAREFESARRLLRSEDKTASRTLTTFVVLERALAAIEREYKTFEDHGRKLVAAREAADLASL